MTERVLRWGILSTARINQWLIPVFAESERNDLVAVASRNPARAAAYADQWGIPMAFGSYEDLLARDDVDVVYNPTPNHLHVPLTIAAAEAGKHVLCEKPVALTLEDVDAVSVAAAIHEVVVTEGFMYRHHPQTAAVRDLVASGSIGTPVVVRGSFSFRLSDPDDIRLDPTMGGGSLWDIGCYPVSFSRTVLGEAPVEAVAWTRPSPLGVDLSCAGQLRFPSGAIAQVDSSFEAPLRAHVEVVGTEGVVVVPHPFKPEPDERIFVGRSEADLEPVPVPHRDLYAGEVEDLAAAVIEGADPVVSLADSRVNTACLVALLRSAAEGGRPVAV
jgi:predicted dehydrogenase